MVASRVGARTSPTGVILDNKIKYEATQACANCKRKSSNERKIIYYYYCKRKSPNFRIRPFRVRAGVFLVKD
jgi:hypothetical protein